MMCGRGFAQKSKSPAPAPSSDSGAGSQNRFDDCQVFFVLAVRLGRRFIWGSASLRASTTLLVEGAGTG
jgi:hypothetical protein